jgi:hypothetical protein
VLPDANKEQTLNAIAGAAFGAAGQRCMALPVVILVGEAQSWLPDLVAKAKSLKVNAGHEPHTDLGPLINTSASARVKRLIDEGVAAGATLELDGRKVRVSGYEDGNFVGPTIFSGVGPGMSIYDTEIFGPVLTVISDIAFVRYGAPDLDVAERFFTDFGLFTVDRTSERLVLRAAGTRPICYIAEKRDTPGLISIGLETREAIEAFATIDGASPVEALPDMEGIQRVRLTSPNGLTFELVTPMRHVAAFDVRPALTWNPASNKPRKNAPQRPMRGPSDVLRLGHCALTMPEPLKEIDWILKTFGMLVSDYLVDPATKEPVAAFMRMNRGAEVTDHHTLAVFPGPSATIHHCSFEVEDYDSIAVGSQHLAQQGYQRHWGVGRHVLGSQIFDYWFDPFGNRVEHYTDGDVMDESYTAGRHDAVDENLAVWAPPVPEGFIG